MVPEVGTVYQYIIDHWRDHILHGVACVGFVVTILGWLARKRK